MSSLRASILHHSLPLLSTHSFTRHTLTLALASLRPDLTSSSTPLHANTEQEASTKRTKSTKVSRSKQKTHTKAEASSLASDNVLDTLFGSGTAPARALVRAWEDEGISKITQRPGDMRDRLRSRLEYSAQVGEHLVEAYALMSSPDSSLSLPLPKLPPSILDMVSSLRLPPLYAPPDSATPNLKQNVAPENDQQHVMSLLRQLGGGRLPLIALNPFGPLRYGLRIADGVLGADEKKDGVKVGMMGEPTGSGPEWYTSRLAVGLAYLAAESHLLQPYQSVPTAGEPVESSESNPKEMGSVSNPYLAEAQQALTNHLGDYDSLKGSLGEAQKEGNDLMGTLHFLSQGAMGVLRSRGL